MSRNTATIAEKPRALTALEKNVEASIKTQEHRSVQLMKFSRLHNDTVTLGGYGASLSVERGALVLKSGFIASTIEEPIQLLQKGNTTVKRIIWLGDTGNITLDALQWLQRSGITLLLLSEYDDAIFIGDMGASSTLRRKQYCLSEERAIEFARRILMIKLSNSIETLTALSTLLQGTDYACETIADKLSWLHLDTLPDNLASREYLMRLEAIAAKDYFHCMEGLTLPWQAKDRRAVSLLWHTYSGRLNVNGRAKGAHCPLNALFNFSYGVLAAYIERLLHIEGLDSSCGFYHVDREGRASLVWDLIEAVRAASDRAILEWSYKTKLQKGDFIERTDGVIVLETNTARIVASVVLAACGACCESIVKEYSSWLREV